MAAIDIMALSPRTGDRGALQGHQGQGNSFSASKYRVLILDKLDIFKKPIHILDGVLENSQFSRTADEGLYEGGGTLSEDTFEGYYKGPVDGTYKMWRIKKACETAPDNECSDCKSERGLD